MTSSELFRTQRLLEREVEHGRRLRGAQVCVISDGTFHELVIGDAGLGRTMTAGTVTKVYCAIKPITAIAVARLADSGALNFDAPLREYLPSYRALVEHPITTRHVLNHTAGLHRISAFQVELIPCERRDSFFEQVAPPEGWKVGHDAAYTEAVGWHLLGRLLERVTGEPLREHLRNTVLGPLGMSDTYLGMTTEEQEALDGRLGVNYDLRSPRAFPVLHELSSRVCSETNAAYGGYTTAADLARLYARLLDRLNGSDDPALPKPETLRELTTPARERVYDEILDRECEYGLGFMVDLAEHEFGPCSATSFGHSGWMGGSFGFADPASGVALGAVLNGIVEPAASFHRRPALVRAIYGDLDLPEAP